MIVAQCDWCGAVHPKVKWDRNNYDPMLLKLPVDWLSVSLELHGRWYVALACSKTCAGSWLSALPIDEVVVNAEA